MPPSDPKRNRHPEVRLPQEIEAWLNRHPEDDRSSIDEVWKLAGIAQDGPDNLPLDSQHVERMAVALERATRGAALPPPRNGLRIRSSVRTASAVTVLLLAVIGIGFWLTPVRHAVPLGQTATLPLPDGSNIELNSGSTLSYPRSFGWWSRRVALEGEAFFDVAVNAAPFVVRTFNSSITVLGTRFNVRAWQNDYAPETTVTLEEGRVRFASRTGAGTDVELQPGQMSRITGPSSLPMPPAEVAIEDNLAWRRGGFRFVDAPLVEILEELERRTGSSVRVEQPEISSLRATLYVEHLEDAAPVLQMIAEMRDLRVEVNDGAYLLTFRNP